MKRKIFTLMAAALVSAFAMAEKPTVEVTKTAGAITLDGVGTEAAWAAVTAVPITIETDGPTTIPNCFWKAVWNDDGIYVLVSVEDDKWLPGYAAGSDKHWNYDKPEVYFDVNELLEDGGKAEAGPTTGHSQFSPAFGDGKDGVEQADGDRLYAHKVTGENYVWEYFVPFSYLDQAADGTDYTRPIGFDVTIIDTDVIDGARVRKTWANDNSLGESWTNMDGCGIIKLVGGTAVKSVSAASKASAFVTSGNILRLVNVSNVSLYDVTGKLVATNLNNNASLSALKSGLYVVKADDFTAKIIK